MPSPLVRRLPRELKHNLGKYLGIFLLMTVSITLVSGFLVAASSIERIIDGMRDAYVVEDGRFTTSFEAPVEAVEAVEDLGVTVHENFSYDLALAQDGGVQDAVVRIHQNRTGFNEAAYVEGRAPYGADEIALDRVFCEHNGIEVGDEVQVGGRAFAVSGIMTLPDYAALFEKNSDFVMNTLTFSSGVVDAPAFDGLSGSETFTYSFVCDDRGLSPADRTDLESDLVEALGENGAVLTDLVDADANQGIVYPGEDVEGDQLMWEVLLFLIVIIMAFVFVVLTSATIDEESAIIGTLLASGYRKRELIGHYLALPLFVGLAAAVAGNVLGYTALAEPIKNLYYNSYSLPPYEAFWNWRVFLLTTVLPFALLIGITFVGLCRKLRCTPLQFLRRETARAGVRGGMRLNQRLGFVARFRLRVFLRNLSHFATLFVGIAFASLLLLFGLCMMPTMDHYADSLRDNLAAEHQYTLKAPLEIDASAEEREAFAAATTLATASQADLEAMDPTELAKLAQKAAGVDADANPVNTRENADAAIAQAEKYAAAQLETARPLDSGAETVTVYGVQEDSRYWDDVDVGGGKVAVGRGLAEKCGMVVGEPAAFEDAYADTSYDLVPTSVVGGSTDTAVYMSLDDFNELFGNDAGHFNGYASDEALDLDERYLASDLTPADMDKIGAQMRDSMGDMVGMLVAAAVLVYLVLMYLLTKTVIDRSARAISYMKVFGYRDGEINKLYLHSITVTVIASLLVSLPLVIGGITALLKVVFMKYNGSIEVFTPADRLVVVVLIGVAVYAVVAFLHTRRIKRVPLALALKVQE